MVDLEEIFDPSHFDSDVSVNETRVNYKTKVEQTKAHERHSECRKMSDVLTVLTGCGEFNKRKKAIAN